MSSEILRALRAELAAQGLDAFIIGSEDRHQSEYVSEMDMRRSFVSGFTGSAGTAVVLQDKALLWTDGRYFLQAENQLSAEWTLMKAGLKEVPDVKTWLASNLSAGQVVGVDPWLFQAFVADMYIADFAPKKIELKAVDCNLVDKIWTDRPSAPSAPLVILPENLTGLHHEKKIASVRKAMMAAGAVGALVSALDEVAWLLNLRGGDIPYNPVFFSYAVVTNSDLLLFIDPSKITSEVSQHLGESVKIYAYEDLENQLTELAKQGLICIDKRASWKLRNILGASAIPNWQTPIPLEKSIKNVCEIDGFRNSHIRDGAALTAFLHWLHNAVTSSSPCTLTECQAADKLEEFRGRMPQHMGPSFSTIAGYGPNGAIIHYKPEVESCATLGTDSIFLLDSGAQYMDGTTDVTRTMHFGTPTQHMMECYTAVLKGHIALARMVFPEGVLGSRIDCVARCALWQKGLEYLHGTGHGVGAFLNVHEGPQSVGSVARPGEEGFRAGMTISNEPGYYENGQFGIRIETVMVAKPVETQFNFGGKQYLGFETLTMTPISTKLVLTSELSDGELAYLNDYHLKVRENLMPWMTKYFPEAVDYLIQETQPLQRQ